MELSLLRTDKEITQAYETYVDMVYRLCFTILKNQFDTEDAVQNTFVKLMRYPKRFDSPEHEKAWLLVTASNTCKDALRRTSRREEPLEAQTDLPVPPDSDPASRAVLEAVLALPLKYRMLMDYPGLTQFDDVGEISHFAQSAFAWAHQKGYIAAVEDGKLAPQSAADQELAETIFKEVAARK